MTPPLHEHGPEYPAFVDWEDGTRMPLVRESRWSRTYRHPTKNLEYVNSRFEDGSASITFDELSATWPSWTRTERSDFCYNCSWLRSQADFGEMLRFILHEGDWNDWSGIASCIADVLPRQEAFERITSPGPVPSGVSPTSAARCLLGRCRQRNRAGRGDGGHGRPLQVCGGGLPA
jgi:hypothetical protein